MIKIGRFKTTNERSNLADMRGRKSVWKDSPSDVAVADVCSSILEAGVG